MRSSILDLDAALLEANGCKDSQNTMHYRKINRNYREVVSLGVYFKNKRQSKWNVKCNMANTAWLSTSQSFFFLNRLILNWT